MNMAAGAVIQIGSALASAAPGVTDKAMSYIRRATKGRVNNVSDAVAFVKRGVPQASVVAQGLAQGGMPVDQIMSVDSARGDPALTQLHTSLRQMYGVIGAQIDSTRSNALGHADLPDTTRDVIRMEMARRLRRAFGSLDNAEKIAHALETFTHADYAWAKAMGI